MIKVTVKTARRYNGNPDNGPVGYRGYTAEIVFPQPAEIRGVPLGRTWEEDPSAAIDDLRVRVRAESGVELDIEEEAP